MEPEKLLIWSPEASQEWDRNLWFLRVVFVYVHQKLNNSDRGSLKKKRKEKRLRRSYSMCWYLSDRGEGNFSWCSISSKGQWRSFNTLWAPPWVNREEESIQSANIHFLCVWVLVWVFTSVCARFILQLSWNEAALSINQMFLTENSKVIHSCHAGIYDTFRLYISEENILLLHCV